MGLCSGVHVGAATEAVRKRRMYALLRGVKGRGPK